MIETVRMTCDDCGTVIELGQTTDDSLLVECACMYRPISWERIMPEAWI